MPDQDRPEPEGDGVPPVGQELPDRDEQQHQRYARHDLRVQHRDVQDAQDHGPPALLHGVQADSGHQAEQRGDERGKERYKQCVDERVPDGFIAEHAHVPLQRKTAPLRPALGLIEAEDDQHRDGCVQQYDDEGQIQP